MKKENTKHIYCGIRMDTLYGKTVSDCIEQLKERLGLPVNRIIQDALVFYEHSTRGIELQIRNPEIEKMSECRKEKVQEKPLAEMLEKEPILEGLDQEPEAVNKKESMFSLLSGADVTEYQM